MFRGIPVVPPGEASVLSVDSSLQGEPLLGSCSLLRSLLRSLGEVQQSRRQPPSAQTEHGSPPLSPAVGPPSCLTSPRVGVLCSQWASDICQCGFYVAEGPCLVYLHVYSLRLVYSVCQMVFRGVTALQVTRRQPGNAHRHPGLTRLPATLTF